MADELLEEVVRERERGISEERIREQLLRKGVSEEDVNGAFARFALLAKNPSLARSYERQRVKPSFPFVPVAIVMLSVAGAGALYFYGTPIRQALSHVIALTTGATTLSDQPFVPFAPSPSPSQATAPPTYRASTGSGHLAIAPSPSKPVATPTPPAAPQSSPLPTVTLQATATYVTSLTPVTLIWVSTNATVCDSQSDFPTYSKTTGTALVTPLLSTSYTIICKGPGGTATASVYIRTTLDPGVFEGGVSDPGQSTTPTPTPSPAPTPLPSPGGGADPGGATPPVHGGAGTGYYVDFSSGSDSAAGNSSAPWKHAPGDPSASGKPAAVALKPGDTIYFKGGVHYHGSIKMNASGTAGAPITYDGESWGGKAVIDGSDPITTWAKCASAAACGGNTNWPNIYKTSYIAPAFLTTESEIRLNLMQGDQPIVPAQIPLPPSPYHQENTNYYTVPPSAVTTNTITDARLAGLGGPALVGAWAFIWAVPNDIRFEKITGYNASTNTITFGIINPYTNYDTRYAIAGLNSASVFTQPGQYVYDSGSHTLYVWPIGGADPNSSISGSSQSVGFDINWKSHVAILGFLIEKQTGDSTTEGSGISLRTGPLASDITISDNELTLMQSTGGGAVGLSRAADVTISNNYVHDILGNMRGIAVSGSNILVKNNTLRNIARTGIYFAVVTNGRMTGNTMTDSNSTHGNGLTVYQGSDKITVDTNTVIDANIAFTMESSSNINIYNNVFDGAGNVDKVVADWGGMTGTNYFTNNTVVGSDNKGALYLGHTDGTYVYDKNIVEGDITAVRSSVSHSGNVYTAAGGFMSAKYGWALGPGESIASPAAVFVSPGTRNYKTNPAYNNVGASR